MRIGARRPSEFQLAVISTVFDAMSGWTWKVGVCLCCVFEVDEIGDMACDMYLPLVLFSDGDVDA